MPDTSRKTFIQLNICNAINGFLQLNTLNGGIKMTKKLEFLNLDRLCFYFFSYINSTSL